MKTYQTAEAAAIIGIHPNTVRLYEKLKLIPEAERQKNQYRVFTDCHIAHLKLTRLALQVEVMQNGLRKKIIETVKTSAAGRYHDAAQLAGEYITMVRLELAHAEEAVEIVRRLLSGDTDGDTFLLKRKEVSLLLDISMDTLRNWEMNGLLTVKRRENGYRVYTNDDIRYLKIIRSLRCANYSLESIRRMLKELSVNPDTDIKTALNTPKPNEDIISVCDKLLVSLQKAEKNALIMLDMILDIERQFG